MEKVFIGTLELGDKVDITDPCYNKDVWCRMTTDCKAGTYYAYANINDEGRVAYLEISLNGLDRRGIIVDEIGEIGVDAGMAGFFNNKPDYPDSEWSEMCDKYWCKKDENGAYLDYWLLDYGVVSSSGYGDGCYPVLANKNRDYFTIEFIGDDEYDNNE